LACSGSWHVVTACSGSWHVVTACSGSLACSPVIIAIHCAALTHISVSPKTVLTFSIVV